ncbi:hypothetical protein KQX54_010500 [Cotesia glomerata]|uniref:Uncharacterized protein n=1 Tax=Cotesia glomerata TaxID=32391 RepID=A0AAV7I5J5_COTGL|nr:hypothetical protein KQX54_010500 [Cotesia glomerata]
MANFNSGKIPTEFPMTNIYHNVMVYFKKNESNEYNDKELGTGTLYVTTDMTVWIKKNGEGNGSPFYLSDINEESKKNDAIFAKRGYRQECAKYQRRSSIDKSKFNRRYKELFEEELSQFWDESNE